MSLKQPIGQKRLTNVAVVRYKKKGKRFEIACYKNKVTNWRTGIEKEIDDVLQTTAIFSNVSKGVLAKHEDLVDVFGTDDDEKICRIILQDGEYQVSDKEREMEFDSSFKDVATILAGKCVNPDTNRPYTISMLEKALKDIHFSVDLKKPAKQQALEVLPQLSKSIPIQRAKMRLRIRVPYSGNDDQLNSFLATLKDMDAMIEQQDHTQHQAIIVCQISPAHYRQVHGIVQENTGNKGSVEVVALAVKDQGESHSDFETWHNRIHPPGQSTAQAVPRSSQGGASDAPEGADRNQNGASSQPTKALGLTTRQAENSSNKHNVLYAKGPISDLPEEYASRRDRFQELDDLQSGWMVELGQKSGSSAVDATFFSPNGEKVGAFANARRMALQAKQKAGD